MSTAYDEVSYPAHMHPQAHPDRLAVMGRLFGMGTADIGRCRVLELGCGEGGNLIPAAFSLPTAQFLGIDLAEGAVARAAQAARDLGLDNVDVRAMDIRSFPADAGRFDYIVAHGVYSWVPAEVRDRMLAICRDHLADNGVAYVSYNAYPGARLREIARETMRFGMAKPDGANGSPPEVVRRSRALLKTIADASAPGNEPYAAVLAGEVKRIEPIEDAVLFHDDLADLNEPVYFHEFAAHAARFGFQYLSDADYAETVDRPVRAGLAERLKELAPEGDVVRREQFADFIRGRAFRRTLICHARVTLTRPARPQALRGLYVSSPVHPEKGDDTAASKAQSRFRTPKGLTLSTNHPLARATLERLGGAWPLTISFDELLSPAGGAGVEPAAADLGEFLLTAAAAGAVEFHTRAPKLSTTAGERPHASALARWQARRGAMVTTLTGASVKLEGVLARELLGLLDGTRDRAAVVNELGRLFDGGRVMLSEGGIPVSSTRARQLFRDGIDDKLAQLARLGLLVG
ncbi:MAG TPA: class I SAM-dependent methyltransferase [Tepidisphaeraceae bacterium]|jgi:SAM-dependent methyltransferase